MWASDQVDVSAWLQRLFNELALLFRREPSASTNTQDLNLSPRNNTYFWTQIVTSDWFRYDLSGLLGGCSTSTHAQCEFDEAVTQLLLTESCELSGRRLSVDQVEHGGMIQMRSHDTLVRGMYLCQRNADAVAGFR